MKKVEEYTTDELLEFKDKFEKTKKYDLTIYNIVRYFHLCMENNPNIIDSLFVPRRCVLHSTQVGNLVRENRKMFLHKGSWFKFKGYAYSTLNKIRTKKHKGLEEVKTFEKNNNIPHTTTIDEIKIEIQRRKIKIDNL